MVAHFHLYYSILYIAELIREALENTEEGVKVGGKLVKALKFADDQAMLAGSEYDLQRMMDRLNMVSVNYNMKINAKKTKVLRVNKGSESDNEDSSCRGNYRTRQGILLLRKHDLR